MTASFEERFYLRVRKTETCWWWTGAQHKGYGVFYRRTPTSSQSAYRIAWEMVNGPVPAGLELDHLCRNKLCVRPDHLEAVTHAINQQRRRGFCHSNPRPKPTHCKHGHEFNEQNTYHYGNWMYCRACAANRARARRQTEKEQAA